MTADAAVPASTITAAEAWLAQDPDQGTRAELADLLARRTSDPLARVELVSRFSGPLTFGTAGLRGVVGAGESRMNRVTVIRAAAGLSRVLLQELGPGFEVVIGYDARRGSKQFAVDTADVVTGAGGVASLLPDLLPTPVLAFAVRHMGADAGVMVTASHNPPADNGYKVYLGARPGGDEGAGVQIISPWDTRIAQAIGEVEDIRDVPRVDSGRNMIGPELVDAYIDRVAGLVPAGAPAPIRIVHSAMHGVGGGTVIESLRRAGFTDVVSVPEQAEPDPDFPTVAFPNPEEDGALDLAFATARDVDADIIIANDPDADRCSAAIPDSSVAGGWRQLTGDEIGALLGAQAADMVNSDSPALGGPGRVLASTVVSSRLLGRIADSASLPHKTTLTGFKWIARVEDLAFGYEEAIGYCVDPDGVRDKDGISAAVRLAALASQLRRAGTSMAEELDHLAAKHGVHHTDQYAVRVTDLSRISNAMARLRTSGLKRFGGSPVLISADLNEPADQLPPTDALLYRNEYDDQIIVRPSGTEPKIKCYLEVIEPVSDTVAAARQRAVERMNVVRADIQDALGLK